MGKKEKEERLEKEYLGLGEERECEEDAVKERKEEYIDSGKLPLEKRV